MKKTGHRVYFDRRAGVVRKVTRESEVEESRTTTPARVHNWDNRSSMTWQEFIDRWEQRFAVS